MHGKSLSFRGVRSLTVPSDGERDVVRALAERLPRPARFLVVGGFGLITDLGSFTLVANFGVSGLLARLVSLSLATLITWRLNRALTFERSGRRQHREAVRYAAVTAAAQGASYAVFAVLTITLSVFAAMPQAAIVVGAACGALISYNGHRLFAFAPAPTKNTFKNGDGVLS